MKTKIQNNIKAIILGLIITLGMGYAAAQTFVGPSCSPTDPVGCNVPVPLNVGISAQSKTGSLTLVDLIAANFKLTNPDGTVTGITAGKVLTTDANGVGTWQSTTGFEMRCVPWVSGAANDRCCRINTTTGQIICKEGSGPNGFASSWVSENTAFPASTNGRYSMELIDAFPGWRAIIVCRLSIDTGATQCKTSSAGYGWSIAGPWSDIASVPF